MSRSPRTPLRVALPRPALICALPDELVLRILGNLLVAELATACVNRRFHALVCEPALWMARVSELLPVCTPNARREVLRALEHHSHLWSAQLYHDHDWHARLRRLSHAEAIAFSKYARQHAHQHAYKHMTQFEMVGMRRVSGSTNRLSTIPFIQKINNVLSGKRMNIFNITLLPEKYFVALCTWEHNMYDMVVNGVLKRESCLLRVGDVLQMVRRRTGKIREFRIGLAVETDIPE
jgi:hypothetical protein